MTRICAMVLGFCLLVAWTHTWAGEEPALTNAHALAIVLKGGSNLDTAATRVLSWARARVRSEGTACNRLLSEQINADGTKWRELLHLRSEDALALTGETDAKASLKIARELLARTEAEIRAEAEGHADADLCAESMALCTRLHELIRTLEQAPPDKGKADEAKPTLTPEREAEILGWIKELGSEDFSARDRATKKLTEAGADALPLLRKAERSEDAEVRVRAKRILEARMSLPEELQASSYGRYRGLLRKIEVPQDQPSYGVFNDYGAWSGAAWAGYTELSAGYWVYVAPNWYIWEREWAAEPRVPIAKP